ncbi:NAD(P)-dependent oxidoreductase [Streptomyces sp. NPDC044780]|uniref:NAD-dependent epimerase/dehydratase family protein n=1 Tax=unclassified Streptomyces TaxID=2593676 RepID=UPI0033C552F5
MSTRIAVTGAGGFVMSVFIRHHLRHHPDAEVLALDITEPDEDLRAYLADVAARVEFRRCDVRDASAVTELLTGYRPRAVVHGATVTHVPRWEREDPGRFLDVNVMGTSAVLDAARRTPSVQRVVHISSAAVYGAGTPGREDPQDEDTPLVPDEMYGVSKVSSELVARRFADLYGLAVPIVRFTKVFGPMERPTSSRTAMSLPYHLARAAAAGRPLTVTPRTLRAAGDWISAVDVADALDRLCAGTGPGSGSAVLNLASGSLTPVPELVDLFGTTVVTGTGAEAVDMDPLPRTGKNGTYAIHRAADLLGWRPRDLRRQVAEYRDWAVSHRDTPALRA